ncbi:MFS transporter [Chloroflexota bacterium]
MPPSIKKVFPVVSLAVFSSLLGSGIIVPLFPIFAESMGASGLSLGMIFAGFSIARTIVMPFAGRLSDRRGRRFVLVIGLLGYSLTSFAFIWASNVFMLTLVRALQGLTAGMILPIAQAYIGDIAPEGEEGKWMGYFSATFVAGFGFGPLVGGVITEHFGMNYAFSAMGALNFVAFVIVLIFLPEYRGRETPGRGRASLLILEKSRMMRGIFSQRVALAMGRGVFTAFLPLYAGVTLGLSSSQLGILLAFNLLLMSPTQLVSGKIADRLDRRAMVITGGMLNILFLLVIPFASSFWQLFAVCGIGGFSTALVMPANSALTVAEGKRYGMGLAMAVVAVAFSLGMAAGPILGGVIADTLNIQSVFFFGAGVGLIGVILFYWFTRSGNVIESVDDH